MSDVTMRQLRNHGGDVVDRVLRGEHLTVTRSGRPVAELVPVRRPAMTATALVASWRHLPSVDVQQLRDDLDGVIDPRL